jgi:SOS-response transcriptional repressor LexA
MNTDIATLFYDVKEFIENPDSTFFTKVVGNELKEYGINDKDVLIIDKSLELIEGKLALVLLADKLTVKQLTKEHLEDRDNVLGIVVSVVKSIY